MGPCLETWQSSHYGAHAHAEGEFACLDCHEHGSYDEIIQMTAHPEEAAGANLFDSHYGEMECRLCHNMHQESEDYCAQCHAWEGEVP